MNNSIKTKSYKELRNKNLELTAKIIRLQNTIRTIYSVDRELREEKSLNEELSKQLIVLRSKYEQEPICIRPFIIGVLIGFVIEFVIGIILYMYN